MSHLRFALIGFALFILVSINTPAARAAITAAYYVATNGADTNPGTVEAPWRTIQHAANIVPPGSMVYVRGGIYNEAVTINVSGSEMGGYIVFRNYPGEAPIVDGTGLIVPTADTGLFLIENKSYVVIRGFEIRNYKTAVRDRVPVGIFVRGAGDHIKIRGNRIHHIETNYTGRTGGDALGIAIYGTSAPQSLNHIVVARNELYDLKLGSSESLVLNGNVENFRVMRNRIHDNNNIGIDVAGFEGTSPDPKYDQARNGILRGNEVYNIDSYGNPAYGTDRSANGIYVDGGRDTVIERNIVHATNIGIELASEHAGGSASFVTVRSNFVFHNTTMGIALGGYDELRGSTQNCAIVNNTLFQNDTLNEGNGELLLQYDTRNNTIADNIFYATSQNILLTNPFTQNSGNVLDDNLYFSPGGTANSTWQWIGITYDSFAAYQSATGNDLHSRFVNPRLVSVSLPDLHLQTTSPAIDAGTSLPNLGAYDIDGQPRVQNVVDLGADEVR